MLMDIKCSEVSSINVHLLFDDRSEKDELLAIGDLIDVTYNANGLRKRIEGKILKISTVGNDPKAWYIIVDGSNDFESEQAKFSPMSILDVDVIRKAGTLDVIQTPLGRDGIPFLRLVKGRLQWSKDGFDWHPIRINERDIIEDQEGTMPIEDHHHHHPRPDDDGIEDAVW